MLVVERKQGPRAAGAAAAALAVWLLVRGAWAIGPGERRCPFPTAGLGVSLAGTIFFSAFAGHLPTHALAITAWACLAPIAAAFVLIFRLPMGARGRRVSSQKPIPFWIIFPPA